MLQLYGDRTMTRFATTAFNEREAVFSPIGKYIAYVSDESGKDQVYIQPLSGEGSKIPVSTEGGRSPRWSRDGKEIFYRKGDQVMAVSITIQPSIAISKPVALFKGEYISDWDEDTNSTGDYDVAPDGRFLMEKEVSHDPYVNIVFNWFEEINQAFLKR